MRKRMLEALKRNARRAASSIPLSVSVGSLALTTGCTEILRTDFETNAATWPSGALAGDPAGDSAQVQGDVTANGSSISLHSASAARIELFPGGKPHNTQRYFISFQGVKPTITETPVIAIDALAANGTNACGLEISGGEFRLVSGDGEDVIGSYSAAADQHNVQMVLDLAGNQCGVRIEQFAQGSEPGDPPTAPLIQETGPLVTESFTELDRLRIRWESTAGTNPTQYFLGSVVISKED